jgi:formylglycine-generating enzyme required for sulfatase activity
VTNGEFIEFIEAGGYRKAELWLSLGWMTVNEQRWEGATLLERRDGAWWNFTLAGMRPVDQAEPVTHGSYFEADAFANWYGFRLPTEFEWERLQSICQLKATSLTTERFHPAPVDARIERQIAANLWGCLGMDSQRLPPLPWLSRSSRRAGRIQWQVHVQPDGLRGGSCATSRNHIRASYRNFFQPEKRWQFSGIRLARDPA